MFKTIVTVIGVTAFVFLSYVGANAQGISRVEVCRDIRNKVNPAQATCIVPNNGKQGNYFQEGDPIYILVRFVNTPVGKNSITVTYNRILNNKYKRIGRKEVTFTSRSRNWAMWFPAHYKDNYKYEFYVYMKGKERVRWHKKYCVGCQEG